MLFVCSFQYMQMILVLTCIAVAAIPMTSIHRFYYMLEDIKFWIDCCRVDGRENYACRQSCPKDVFNDTIGELIPIVML